MGLFKAKYRIKIGYGFSGPVYELQRKRGLGAWLIVSVWTTREKAEAELERLRGLK